MKFKTFKKAYYGIEDFIMYLKADPNSIYLVRYPKVGSNWLRYMLGQVISKTYNIDLKNPTTLSDLKEYRSKGVQVPVIIGTHDDSGILSESGRMTDYEKLFIYGGRQRYRKNPVILMVRDPRDVVVSFFHQVTKRSAMPMKIEKSEFVRHPFFGIQRVIRFYQIWQKNKDIPKELLIIRYEDLFKDKIKTLEKAVNFIGIQEVSKELLEEVYESSKAEKMRKLESMGKLDIERFGEDRNSMLVRKGKIGSYLDELSEEDIDFCNRVMRNMPEMYGYEIDAG